MGLFDFLSSDIAIDLGTANTLIINKDKIVVDEPSIIAVDKTNNKVLAIGFNLIPHYFKFSVNHIFRAGYFGRIFKILMELPGPGWKHRAPFLSIIANCNDQIKINITEFIDMVGSVTGNVYSILFHCSDGPGVDTVRFYTRAVNPGFVTGKMFQVTLRHLTSAGIAGT